MRLKAAIGSRGPPHLITLPSSCSVIAALYVLRCFYAKFNRQMTLCMDRHSLFTERRGTQLERSVRVRGKRGCDTQVVSTTRIQYAKRERDNGLSFQT